MSTPEKKLPLTKGVGAPRVYEDTAYPIPDQDGPSGFKYRLGKYIEQLPPGTQIQTVRSWLPGELRFTVDWREQQKRIAQGETYELCITLKQV